MKVTLLDYRYKDLQTMKFGFVFLVFIHLLAYVSAYQKKFLLDGQSLPNSK